MILSKELIELNRKYHDGFAGMAPWPASWLFIGDDGAASCYALDLDSAEGQVRFLDHGNPDKAQIESESFQTWIDQEVRE